MTTHKRNEAEQAARIERLSWFVSTLQHALGVSIQFEAEGQISQGPLKMVFRVIISDQALMELLREPSMRQSLLDQVYDSLKEQMEEWVKKLNQATQRE